MLITSAYVMVSAVFDMVDSHRLLAQVDAHLQDRLHDTIHSDVVFRSPGEADDDHGVETAPILLWHVDGAGRTVALSDATPNLPRTAWAKNGVATTAQIGSTSFRLLATRAGVGWLVAGQSLTDTTHVQDVLVAAEVIAGPVIVVAAFLGALVIGLKASRPVEAARQRQLEFTADASHELRTPLSVIEAEVSLALGSRRPATQYRATLERVGGESKRLRRIIEDLLWLARFDSEPALPRSELVDLNSIADDCADRFGAIANASGIALSVEHRRESSTRLDGTSGLDRSPHGRARRQCLSLRRSRWHCPHHGGLARQPGQCVGRRQWTRDPSPGTPTVVRPLPPCCRRRHGYRPRTRHRRFDRALHRWAMAHR